MRKPIELPVGTCTVCKKPVTMSDAFAEGFIRKPDRSVLHIGCYHPATGEAAINNQGKGE